MLALRQTKSPNKTPSVLGSFSSSSSTSVAAFTILKNAAKYTNIFASMEWTLFTFCYPVALCSNWIFCKHLWMTSKTHKPTLIYPIIKTEAILIAVASNLHRGPDTLCRLIIQVEPYACDFTPQRWVNTDHWGFVPAVVFRREDNNALIMDK